MPPLFSVAADGAIRFAVRLSPRASREGLEGVASDAAGGRVLRVAVHAPPEDGKANRALFDVLADAFGVARARLSLVSGAASRTKILRLGDADAALLARLNRMIDTLESAP